MELKKIIINQIILITLKTKENKTRDKVKLLNKMQTLFLLKGSNNLIILATIAIHLIMSKSSQEEIEIKMKEVRTKIITIKVAKININK